jgi:hypothetical protein
MDTTVKNNVVADVTPCSQNFRYIYARPYGVTSKRVNINHKHNVFLARKALIMKTLFT